MSDFTLNEVSRLFPVAVTAQGEAVRMHFNSLPQTGLEAAPHAALVQYSWNTYGFVSSPRAASCMG